jgi:putative copper export protein
LRFSKWIVALVISLNVVFTGIVLYIFWVTQYEPSTLITS